MKTGKKDDEKEGSLGQVANLSEEQLREIQKQLNALPNTAKGVPQMPPPFPHHSHSNNTGSSSSTPTPGSSPPYGIPFVHMPPAGSGHQQMTPVYYPQYTAPPNFMSTPKDPLEAMNDFGCVPSNQNHQDFRKPGPELLSNSSGPRSNQSYAQDPRSQTMMPSGGFNQGLDPRVYQHQAYQREPKNLALTRIKNEAGQAENQMNQMRTNWNLDQQKANLEQQMMRQQRDNAQKYATMFLNQQAANFHGQNQGNKM